MNSYVHELLRTLVLVVVGGVMTIVGSKMHDDVTRSLGVGIVMSALGLAMPGRDSNNRTRTTDEPPDGRSSGR